MNKKFSTLLTAGLLVGGSLFSYVDAAVVKTSEDLAKYLKEGVLTLPADDNELEFAADGKYSLTGGYMVVKNEKVKIFASAGKKVEINGRLIIAKDGVSVSNLHFVNQANGDGGYWNMNTISVFADKVTLTGNTIEIKAAEGEAIGNGIVVFPQNEKVSYTISGNKIIGAFSQQKGYASTGILLSVNSEINERKSQADQPLAYGKDFKAVTADVKEGLNASAIAKANTYENCFIDLVQHEGVVLTGDTKTDGAYAYSQVSFDEEKTYNADALKDAIESATEDGSIDFKGTAAQLEDLTKGLTSNVAINTNDGIVISGVARLQPSIETAAGVYNLLAAKPATDEYNLLVRYSEWAGGKGSFIVTVDKDGKPGQIELEDLTAEQATADNNLWKMEQYLDKDGDYTFIFTNKADQKLTVDGKSFFHSVGNAPYDNGVVFEMDEKDLSAKTPKYYGLYKAATHPLTAKDLYFIEKTGFTITIDGKLAGDPFTGNRLAPMSWNGTTFVKAADAETAVSLKTVDGKYIVAKKTNAGGTAVNQYVYAFTTVSEKDLIAERKLEAKKRTMFDVFTAYHKPVSANDNLEVLTSIDSLTVQVLNKDNQLQAAPVGYFKLTTDGTKTLGASIEYKLFPISIAMGNNVVDPVAFLKDAFFTITKLDEKNGNRIYAVNGCGNRGWVKEAGNVLDTQWAVTYDEEVAEYTFTNRENQNVSFPVKKNELRENGTSKEALADDIYTDGENLYKIVAVEGEESDGYNWLGDIKNQRFHIAHFSSVYENNAWISADKDANAILTLDEDKAVELRANIYSETGAVDTIKVESVVNYYDKDGNLKEGKHMLKVPTYEFYNGAGEGFGWAGEEGKYSQIFVFGRGGSDRISIREDGDNYILRLVDYGCNKIYAGTSTNFLSKCDMYDINNSLFVVEPLNRPEYRRLGATVEDDFTGKIDTAKFYRTNDVTGLYLFENSKNLNTGKEAGLNFLGEVQSDYLPKGVQLPFVVDTAYVRYDTPKPLYLLAVRANIVKPEADKPCEVPGHGMNCEHAVKGHAGYVEGDYLVNLVDSAYYEGQDVEYKNFTRLAFVPAKHIGDTLQIKSSKWTNSKDAEEAAKDSIFFSDKDGKQLDNNAAAFAFRLVDPKKAKEENMGDFYIENNAKGQTRYVHVLNSVPVLVYNLEDASTFNVEAAVEGEKPTSNEGIVTSEVKVIAGEGQVTIAGAAGKKVVISNILGQVVANTVLASDNAVIAAPQGVVVVAVEGEEAVKAIVK